MAYITNHHLLESAKQFNLQATNNIVNFASSAQLTIFLSHSHKDREQVRGLIHDLGRQGIKLYVDWNDEDMPRETSRTTADKIKTKIKEMHVFLVLGTKNAMKSVWVPWETGIADQCKQYQQLFIVPVSDNNGTFEGNEYFQLYNRIEPDALGTLRIMQPHQNLNEGIKLSEYNWSNVKFG